MSFSVQVNVVVLKIIAQLNIHLYFSDILCLLMRLSNNTLN